MVAPCSGVSGREVPLDPDRTPPLLGSSTPGVGEGSPPATCFLQHTIQYNTIQYKTMNYEAVEVSPLIGVT
jgi:hypothetical protein